MTCRLALITLWLVVTAVTAAPRQKRQNTNVVINADTSRHGYVPNAMNVNTGKGEKPSLPESGNDALKDIQMRDGGFMNGGLAARGNMRGGVNWEGVDGTGDRGGACNNTSSGCVTAGRGGLFGMIAALMNAVGRIARHIMMNASRMNNTGIMTVVVDNETLTNGTAGMMGGGMMGGMMGSMMGGMGYNKKINVTGGMMRGGMMGGGMMGGGMMGGGMMGGGMMGGGMMGGGMMGANRTTSNRGGMIAMMVKIMGGKRRLPGKKLPCGDDCVLDKEGNMATVTSDLHQNNADRPNTLRNQDRISILSLLLKKKKSGLHSKLLRLLRKANL